MLVGDLELAISTSRQMGSDEFVSNTLMMTAS